LPGVNGAADNQVLESEQAGHDRDQPGWYRGQFSPSLDVDGL